MSMERRWNCVDGGKPKYSWDKLLQATLSTTNPTWTGLKFEHGPPVGLEDSVVPVLHRIPRYKNFGEIKWASTYSGGEIQSLRFIYCPGERGGAHLVEAGRLAVPASMWWWRDKLLACPELDNGCPAYSELTNSVEQSSSWETNRLSVTQEILGILWNPTIHYLVHNSLPLVPVLSHMNPLNALPCLAYKIHFNL